MQQQMASVPLPNTKTYMVAPMLTTDDAGISTEPVNEHKKKEHVLLSVSPKPSLILIMNLPSLDRVSVAVEMFRLNSGSIVTSSNSLDDLLTGWYLRTCIV